MYPVYRGLSSYPYERTQMPPPQHYHPSWEAALPRVKEEQAAAGPSYMYEPWPQNYGYPVPMQCPNCCNHAQYPPAHYNFRPPCPHFPSPQPAYGHFCGGYPSYPQPSYPVKYVPPPHYTNEPRYEYHKNAPGEFHCCGCSNHPCHLKEGKQIMIEEHEPEVETKKSESLVPARAEKFTQPILWIPPGYTMNKEQQQLPRRVVENEADKQHISPYYVRKPLRQQRPIETEVKEPQESPRVKKLHWQRRPTEGEPREHVESPHVMKPQRGVKTVEQEPNVKCEWLPLDMNSIRELLEGGEGRKAHEQESRGGHKKNTQDVENKEHNKQFPFPIIWMPYDGQGENDVKGRQEKDAGETQGREASPTFKVIPMRFEYPDNEPEKIKTAVGDDGTGVGSQATERSSTVKTIPVQQSQESVPNQLTKDAQQKDKEKPVKSAEGNGNAQSSSPTKKSKLPPICLRVDPPKKKNGNGSSRSPSPPVDKKRQESEESKTGGSKKEIKVAEAVDQSSSQSEIEVSRKAGEEKKEKLEDDAEKKVVEWQQSLEAKESKPQEAKKPTRKILSEQEAATIIQSAYRGFDVRRWEPLKKLKQIAKVREEAAEVQKRIEDLESNAGSCVDEKEKATVAEIIMKLLLKLDTIQGLHPSFRDVRRSVAKELIILQEKLDSVINKIYTPVAQESSTAEEPSKVSSLDECSKEVTETVEESATVSSQLEGSKDTEIVEEPSNVFGVDERTRDIDETAEESSKKSSQVDSSQEEFKSSKACEEAQVPKLNEASSVQPPTSQVVVDGSEYDPSLETSPVKMESQNEPQDVSASSSQKLNIVDSQADTKAAEPDGSETVSGKLPTESQESPACIDTVEHTTEQVEMASGQNDEQVNLHAELPREVVEDGNEIPQVETDPGTALKEELEVESEPAKKQELALQAELAHQEGTEQAVMQQRSEISSSETSEEKQEDHSGDIKDEATLSIEPKSCKPESGELSIIDAQKDQEAEPVDIDIPILEQSEHVSGEPIAEKAAPAEADSQVSEVTGASIEEAGETRQSPKLDDLHLESSMASPENQLSHDEIAHKLVNGDQEGKFEENNSAWCQLNDQAIRSETQAPQTETEQPKLEEAEAPKESKQGREEEQVDKRIIEENEKLRQMLERIIISGKEQQDLISSLSGKVKDLEKQLARKKKMKSSKIPKVVVSRASCGNGKPSNGSIRARPMGAAS